MPVLPQGGDSKRQGFTGQLYQRVQGMYEVRLAVLQYKGGSSLPAWAQCWHYCLVCACVRAHLRN